ncbi:DeoR/GlpR family DNA-binding transcription regulator [Lichenifustis flavocetrariae]|uniref:DeoR/GlpR family DNA-binding transcription regulator n=1 Tax=Lichenifustis flavocetrariae TaxID=2949735 RepID=A0AA42CGS7_9HYPH|nr:DeoR/GlpR family DNA-binding transcription regulator [Lichenifustis flavocetrariae]MCW6506873.1 DeoR/GlpR family DNA-binding transcription regulator [Lichenifustis flavocetrariae]
MAVSKAKRVAALADGLSERRVMHLRDAASMLGVSEMTVRRDIADHADQFTYLGGHIMLASEIEPDRPYELATAADSHAQAKRDACVHAAKHIRDEETIFIDCGTTLIHMIDLIPDTAAVTVICYALNVAERLARRPNITMLMLGGLFYPASASFSAHQDLALLDGIGINVAFLSAAGVDAKRGATCEHFHEAQVKRKVLSLARESYLVADTSKIGKLKRAFFAPLGAFTALIAENGEIILPAD